MQYVSTRGRSTPVSSAQAIVNGIAPDGGLYTPECIPAVSAAEMDALRKMDYPTCAAWVLGKYLTDFTQEELLDYTHKAYTGGRFVCPDTGAEESVGLKMLPDGNILLNLWYGPTAAFKDMALQMLPWLLTASLRKTGEQREVCILVATSGDTGKAALEGFRDVPGTRIVVFYPRDGVSTVQRLQMVTQEGGNVGVCAVDGNFDDAQTGVKVLFADEAVREKLNAQNRFFSSANSINWGRLAPQIAYYAYASLRYAQEGSVDVCVPTGNFGNILAAYFAKRMGFPIGRLICASNRNNVLTDFLKTGVYDRNRQFYLTESPSMDILISSNVERLLYHLSGADTEFVSNCMASLSKDGRYCLNEVTAAAVKELFDADFCTDAEAAGTIRQAWQEGELIDTHTAVALHVLRKMNTGRKTVVASTASAFKFAGSVYTALTGKDAPEGVAAQNALRELTGVNIPAPLTGLEQRSVRFDGCTAKSEMEQAVFQLLGGR